MDDNTIGNAVKKLPIIIHAEVQRCSFVSQRIGGGGGGGGGGGAGRRPQNARAHDCMHKEVIQYILWKCTGLIPRHEY